jgi:soluble lytic murein transglycosylase-like protein
MSIPIKNNSNILHSGVAGNAQQLGQMAPGSAGNGFQNLLAGLIKNAENQSLNSATSTVLDKKQVALLHKTLQVQRNHQLFNVIFNNAMESNFLASKVMQDLTASKFPGIPEASKNSQTTPKSDVFKANGNLEQIIQKAASKYNVDADLIRSVIKAESNFNPQATSPKGAMGLMQLMPETARDLGVKNAYDAEENIMGGTRYLKTLLDRYDGKVDLVLAAYNWGMGNVEKNPDRLPEETLSYIERVNSYYNNMKA